MTTIFGAARRKVLRLAVSLYAANIALGLAVATKRLDTSGVKWLHHTLFTGTVVSTAASALAHLTVRDRRGWVVLAAAGALLAVTRTRGRQASHPVVALTALPVFGWALLMKEG